MSELATERVNNKVIDLVSIFKNNINTNNGITKIDNMLLSAIEAQNNNEPEYLILACLFHELGYYLRNEYLNFHDIHNHNLIATDYLMNLGMNARVCYLVEKFLESKRYLYTINAEMYNNLPYLEKIILQNQGGLMTSDELFHFELDDEFPNFIRIIKYNTIKKNKKDLIPIDYFIPLIKRFIS